MVIAMAPASIAMLVQVNVVDEGNGGSFGEYKAGDELEIRVVGDTVSYHKNGALLHTSTRKPVFPLRADCSFDDPGARAEGVRLLRC